MYLQDNCHSKMIALCIITFIALIVPMGYYVYQKMNTLENRCHDLHMKEIIIHNRVNKLDKNINQLEVNIMTFSLDLHAHEKKSDEKDCIQTQNKNAICNRMDKLEHELSMIKEKYEKWLSVSYSNQRRLEGW